PPIRFRRGRSPWWCRSPPARRSTSSPASTPTDCRRFSDRRSWCSTGRAPAVAKANADGYTLLFANSGHSILGLLNKDLAFDPIRDFAGIAMIGTSPAIVVVPQKLGV